MPWESTEHDYPKKEAFPCPSSAPVGKKLKAAGDGLSSAVTYMTMEHQISFKVGCFASVNKIKIVKINTNVK